MRFILMIILFIWFPSSFALQTLVFPDACANGQHVSIAAVGDVLLHGPLQRKAFAQGFQSLWIEAIPYIRAADIAYANLEGPMADGVTRNGQVKANTANYYDNNIYSSYPVFNYHSRLGMALKNSGFSIVSTANNHSLDRFSIGIDKTINALNQSQLSFVGTKLKNGAATWSRTLTRGSVKVAFISCTGLLNGQVDKYNQVLHCYQNRDVIINLIESLRGSTDAVIVLPHWGEEYQTQPNGSQRRFAHDVLEAGAIAVIGSHPHVLQPMEKYMTKDGRATFIMYSLGNFVSYQGTILSRSTIILLLGLTKTAQGTIINQVKYVPMFMQNRGGVDKIALTRLQNTNTLPYQMITHLLPPGNVLQGLKLNPSCFETNPSFASKIN